MKRGTDGGLDSCSKRAKTCEYCQQVALYDLRSELTGVARCSKRAISRVLTMLKEKSKLADDHLGGSAETKHLNNATRLHGDATTIYGSVVHELSSPIRIQ